MSTKGSVNLYCGSLEKCSEQVKTSIIRETAIVSYCVPACASLSLRWNAKSKNTVLDYNIWQLCSGTIFILSALSLLQGEKLRDRLAEWMYCTS